MKKETQEKINDIGILILNYMQPFGYVFFILFFIHVSIFILQTQEEESFKIEGYSFLFASISLIFMPLWDINKLKQKEQQKEAEESSFYTVVNKRKKNHFYVYMNQYITMFVSVYLIAQGILDLQSNHYPEENYQYIGTPLIVLGVMGILFTQWRYKKIKRKEIN